MMHSGPLSVLATTLFVFYVVMWCVMCSAVLFECCTQHLYQCLFPKYCWFHLTSNECECEAWAWSVSLTTQRTGTCTNTRLYLYKHTHTDTLMPHSFEVRWNQQYFRWLVVSTLRHTSSAYWLFPKKFQIIKIHNCMYHFNYISFLDLKHYYTTLLWQCAWPSF